MFVKPGVFACQEGLFQAVRHLLDRNGDPAFFAEDTQQLSILAEHPEGNLELHVAQGFHIREIRFEHKVGDTDGGDPQKRRNQGKNDELAKELLHTPIPLCYFQG
jgi:hypothetical protein